MTPVWVFWAWGVVPVAVVAGVAGQVVTLLRWGFWRR